jgi:hypothetical protein
MQVLVMLGDIVSIPFHCTYFGNLSKLCLALSFVLWVVAMFVGSPW